MHLLAHHSQIRSKVRFVPHSQCPIQILHMTYIMALLFPDCIAYLRVCLCRWMCWTLPVHMCLCICLHLETYACLWIFCGNVCMCKCVHVDIHVCLRICGQKTSIAISLISAPLGALELTWKGRGGRGDCGTEQGLLAGGRRVQRARCWPQRDRQTQLICHCNAIFTSFQFQRAFWLH